jgi:hypothetical protein
VNGHVYTCVVGVSIVPSQESERHVYTCVVGVSIVPSQESERTCVYMCGRGINCTEPGK